MKKYILMLFAMVIALASCTNDDITITHATSFKINPSTVIAPFTYEVNAGELEGIPSSYKLRIRLLIYTAEGDLVKEEESLYTSYASTMAVNTYLAKGDYIAIAISDIVSNDKETTYWDLSNYDMLSTTTITKTEWIGDYGREILGVAKSEFSVLDDNSQEIKIDIKPAGSLFLVRYWGVQRFKDVISYELAVSKIIDDCKFDKQGNFTPTWENCEFKRRINVHKTEGNTGNNYYHYAYVLPTNNLKLKYRAWLVSEEYYDITPEMNVSPKAGEEYCVIVDLDEWGYTAPYLINNEGRSIQTKLESKAEHKDVNYLKDLVW